MLAREEQVVGFRSERMKARNHVIHTDAAAVVVVVVVVNRSLGGFRSSCARPKARKRAGTSTGIEQAKYWPGRAPRFGR